jgi:hydroxymethylpyrimidine/phosphomethylpyrimidine kinase
VKRVSPIAMTVAGSDSGGGAGIQADLKTFCTLGVHGTSVITCITAQNPKEITGVQPTPSAFVKRQLSTVFSEIPPSAVKTGMLYSPATIREVGRFLGSLGLALPAVVVDPVMVASSGSPLLRPQAVETLIRYIFPFAALITPNLDEAAVLLGHPIQSRKDHISASIELFLRFGRPVLLKGGHLKRERRAVDIFFDGQQQIDFSADFVRHIPTHGTGCVYSAAITAWLARGTALTDAIENAKRYVTRAIAQSTSIWDHPTLFHPPE